MQDYMYKEFIAVKPDGISLLSRADFITKDMPTRRDMQDWQSMPRYLITERLLHRYIHLQYNVQLAFQASFKTSCPRPYKQV